VVGVGFLLGLIVGRWWAVAAAVVFGIYVGVASDVDISPWLYGFLTAAIGAGAVISGLFLRKLLEHAKPS